MANNKLHLVANEFTADSILPKRSVNLESAVINQQGRLEVILNKQKFEFPATWLRHSCQCKKCFSTTALSFTYILGDILKEDSLTLKSVSIVEGALSCVFKDDHTVNFDAEWLYNRRMTEDGIRERSSCMFDLNPVFWPKGGNDQIQQCSYREVTETESGMEKFTGALIRDGMFMIKDTPDRMVSVEFTEKTGFVRVPTHYAQYFVVKTEAMPVSFAYNSEPIDFHVDLPYLLHYPCIQLLHFMKQAKEGGENMLCDGVKAAMVLRERNPEHYKVLTTTKIQHEDMITRGDLKFYMAGSWTPIVVGDNGEPICIRWNHSSHSSYFPGLAEDYEAYFKAMIVFYKLLYEHSIKLKCEEGDILVMDNKRLMHARQGFRNTEARELEGWYIDWDAVHSRERIARIKRSKNCL